MTTTQVYDSTADLQRACADQIAQALAPSIDGRTVTIALSGGSTPRKMHEMLAAAPGIDWSHVHVFWGDERTVPPDHEACNYRMARESLLDRVALPDANIHRMHGEKDPHQAADEYERKLRAVFGVGPGEFPVFDVIVLGIGEDGHTASLFPGTQALDEEERLAVANEVPQLDTTRLTLTYPVLNAARLVLFLVAGASKADAVRECLSGDDAHLPAARVRPTYGELRWLLDREAASRL